MPLFIQMVKEAFVRVVFDSQLESGGGGKGLVGEGPLLGTRPPKFSLPGWSYLHSLWSWLPPTHHFSLLLFGGLPKPEEQESLETIGSSSPRSSLE